MSSDVSRFLIALVAATAVLAACRDLDYPGARARPGEAPPPNDGPAVSFSAPSPASRVALRTDIRLIAEDVNGVREVNLSCNAGVPLRRWIASPFEGSIDLTPCTTPASTLQPVTLTAEAIDALGARGEAATLALEVDREAALLTVELPERAAPGGSLVAIVRSDRELQAPPEVRIEGTSATVTSTGTNVWTAQLSPLPGLPSDAAATPTFDQLSQVERPLAVSVEGRSRTGNPTRVDRNILLSRVLWSRYLPDNIIAPTGASLYASASAVGLHLPIGSNNGASLSADGGTYFPPTAETLDGGNGRVSPLRAFDDFGNGFFDATAGNNEFLVVEPVTGTSRGPFPTTIRVGPHWPVGDSICGEIDTTGSCGLEVRCESNTGVTRTAQIVSIDGMAAQFASQFSVSEGSYLSFGNACCSSGVYVGNYGGGFCLSPLSSSVVFPTYGGEFVVYEIPPRIVRVDGTSQQFPGTDGWSNVLAARRDETLLQATTSGLQTTFRIRSVTGEVAAHTVVGTFGSFASDTILIRDRTYVVDTDNAVTVLVNDGANGVHVMRFDGGGRPRWIYRLGNSGEVSGSSYLRAALTGPVYFVDPVHDRVIAFAR